MEENKVYYIFTGEKSGFYTLRVSFDDYVYNYGVPVRQFRRDYHVRNLSTDKFKAIQKAKDYIGDQNYKFNADSIILEEWGHNEPKEEYVYRSDANAHVTDYYQDKEFIETSPIPFSDDRQTFTGEIHHIYSYDNDYGDLVMKMHFLDDRGFIVNSTIPSKIRNHRMDNDLGWRDGIRFSFQALLSKNDYDGYKKDFELIHEHCFQRIEFARAKRPTKIEII